MMVCAMARVHAGGARGRSLRALCRLVLLWQAALVAPPAPAMADESGQVITVEPYSTRMGTHFFREDLEPSGNCTAEGRVCPSLQDALELAWTIRTQERAKDDLEPRNGSNASSPALPPAVAIKIRLLADWPASCKILLRRITCNASQWTRDVGECRPEEVTDPFPCLQSLPLGVEWHNRRMANIAVDVISLNDNCSMATLVPPSFDGALQPRSDDQTGTRRGDYLLHINNSSAISMRNIRLDTLAARLASNAEYRALVRIENSTLIRFVHCEFLGENFKLGEQKHSHAQVLNAAFVAFEDCLFNERKAHLPVSISKLEKIFLNLSDTEHGAIELVAPAVDIRLNGNGHGHVDLLAEERDHLQGMLDVLPRNELCVNTTETHPGGAGTSDEPFLCLPTILLHRCTFSGIGSRVDLDRAPHHLRAVDSSAVLGMAISVKMATAVGQHVLIHSCAVQDTYSVLGTAVLLHIEQRPPSRGGAPRLDASTAPTASTSVQVVNNTFSENTGLYGGAMAMLLDSNVTIKSGRDDCCQAGVAVLVKDTRFVGNRALLAAGAVLVRDKSPVLSRISVAFSNVLFMGNYAASFELWQPGGSLFITSDVRFPNEGSAHAVPVSVCKPVHNQHIPIQFHSVKVLNSSGLGAIFIRDANAGFCGSTDISYNRLSAIAIRYSRLFFSGDLRIRGNKADNGGVFSIQDHSLVTLEQVTHLVASGNQATGLGAIAFVDSRSSAMTAFSAIFTKRHKKEMASHCPFVLPRYFRNASNLAELKAFFDRSGDDMRGKAVSIIFMASLHSCMGLYTDTLIKLKLDDLADPHYCMPYAPANWELSEEDAPHREILAQYSSSGPCLEGCARLRGRLNCKFRLNDSDAARASLPKGSWSDMDGHGDDVCRTAVQNCTAPNAYLSQPGAFCYSRRQRITVVNRPVKETMRLGPAQPPFGSNVAWLLFSNTTTSCYKEVGGVVWYFHNNCSREAILERARQSTERLKLQTDCSLLLLAKRYHDYAVELPSILPGYEYTLVPWAAFVLSWNERAVMRLNDSNSPCVLDDHHRFDYAPRSISKITLHPAPGEHIQLSIFTFDEMFNKRDVSLLISVETDTHDVVLGHNTFLFRRGDEELAASGRSITKLILYGPPGAEGVIAILVKDRLTLKNSNGIPLSLRIPFRLRKCHFGFNKTRANSNRARDLIDTFHNADSIQDIEKARDHIKDELQCKCPAHDECVQECEQGKYVHIRKHCWAGRKEKDTNTSMYQPAAPYKVQEQFNMSSRTFFIDNCGDPLGEFQQEKNTFVAEPCSKDSCAFHEGKSMYWKLEHDNPCVAETNTTGPLCSNCPSHLRYSLESSFCDDCTPTVHLGVFFVLLFIVTSAAFVALLLLNVGVTAPLDTWFLFSQVFFCINGSFYSGGPLFVSLITLGLGKLCIIEHLSPMSRQATLMASPIMSLLIVVALYTLAARRVGLRVLQRLQRRKSIRHVIWLVVLWTSGVLCFQALMLVRCTQLGRGNSVLVIDSTVACFGDQHRPFAALALAVIVLFVLPPPVLLAWRPTHIWPSLIGTIDEATCLYEPHCRWWAVYNIGRRIAFSTITALSIDGLTVRCVLVLMLVVQLAIQGVVRPFRRDAQLWRIKDIDNVMEFVVLVALTIMAVYRIVQVDVCLGPSRKNYYFQMAVLAIISSMLFVSYISRFLKSWRDTLQQRSRTGLKQLWTEDSDDERCAVASRSELCMTAMDGRRSGTPEGRQSGSAGGHDDGTSCRQGAETVRGDERVATSLREPLLLDQLLDDVEDN